MIWLDPDTPREEVLNEITDSGHSRFPVAGRRRRQDRGRGQNKELFAHLARTGTIDHKAVMHPPLSCPKPCPC